MTIRDALKGTVERIGDALRGFHPSCFDDPIAEQTPWSGMTEAEDTNARSLFRILPHKMLYSISAYGWLKPALLACAGIFCLKAGTEALRMGEVAGIAVLLIGPMLLVFAVHITKRRLSPKIFDTRQGMYWEGRQPATPGIAADKGERTSCRLEDIHAIQVLWHRVADYNGVSYSSHSQYELNLVLNDAGRIHVVASVNRERLREDGQRLADFLGVPLWDATRFGMGPR